MFVNSKKQSKQDFVTSRILSKQCKMQINEYLCKTDQENREFLQLKYY